MSETEKIDVKIIPLEEYYKLNWDREFSKNLIYPVPDPNSHFLCSLSLPDDERWRRGWSKCCSSF
jgi:hypothetical protein